MKAKTIPGTEANAEVAKPATEEKSGGLDLGGIIKGASSLLGSSGSSGAGAAGGAASSLGSSAGGIGSLVSSIGSAVSDEELKENIKPSYQDMHAMVSKLKGK